MNVDIYAASERSTFIAVLSGNTAPAQAIWLFKQVWLERGKPRFCLDTDEVMSAIVAGGYAAITA